MTKTMNLNSNCIRVVLQDCLTAGPDISPLTIDLTEGGGVTGTGSDQSCSRGQPSDGRSPCYAPRSPSASGCKAPPAPSAWRPLSRRSPRHTPGSPLRPVAPGPSSPSIGHRHRSR